MKYQGEQIIQDGKKKQKQIDLNLNIVNMQKPNGSHTRPFSSNSSRSNMTQRSAVSSSSGSQKASQGVLVIEPGEVKAKKNVIFSRETTNILDADEEYKDFNDGGSANQNGHESRDVNSPIRGILSPRSMVAQSNQSASGKSASLTRQQGRQLRRSTSATPSLSSVNGHLVNGERKRRPQSKRRVNSSSESTAPSEGTRSPPRSGRRSRKNGVKSRQRSNSNDSSDSEIDSPRSSRQSPPNQNLNAETMAALEAVAEAQKQAWTQFENHVKNIDDSTDFISRIPRKKFNASDVFQSVMKDMYGNTEYGKTRAYSKLRSQVGHIAAYASRFIGKVKALHQLQGSQELEEDEGEFSDCEDFYQPSKETVENARRGWRILRQHVQEMAAEKRMSQSTLSWNMLRHTVRGLTNMERARYDLYQRYGLVPMVRSDGTVVQENTMLSERARSALANKPKVPAVSTNRQFSATSNRRPAVYKSIDGFHSFSRLETS